jgi:cell division protein FtsN
VNQLAFYRSRCAAVPQPAAADTARAAAADSARRAAPPVPRPDTAAPARFEVQVAATRSRTQAQTIAHRVERSGERARIVAGTDRYFRVRAGPYLGRKEADAALVRLRRLLGGHPIVVAAP